MNSREFLGADVGKARGKERGSEKRRPPVRNPGCSIFPGRPPLEKKLLRCRRNKVGVKKKANGKNVTWRICQIRGTAP